jgi:hypothetical protein
VHHCVSSASFRSNPVFSALNSYLQVPTSQLWSQFWATATKWLILATFTLNRPICRAILIQTPQTAPRHRHPSPSREKTTRPT